LVSSNDNDTQQKQSGTNTLFTAAVAAAGLTSTDSVAAEGTDSGNDNHQGNAPADLLQATAGAAHGDSGHGGEVAAQGVVMPSADQMAALAASANGANAPEAAKDGQHNEIVGKVLVDALHGGDSGGQTIDHLLDAAVTNGAHGHANPALEALASQVSGDVSFGHSAFAASFHGGNGLPMMDALAVHQDAAPAHG
jgi:hypothetical protein